MVYFYNKRGSIGITIVMMVFCFLMSISMAYQKSVQTENMIRKGSDYTDRAFDAAFSGINYAMASIQASKDVFYAKKICITPTPSSGDINILSRWVNLSETGSFDNYYDEDRKINGSPEGAPSMEKIPPYRFIVSCNTNSYYETGSGTSVKQYILIKSYGEYLKYEEDKIVATYSAQLMAECLIDKNSRTISLKRYRRMQPQIVYDEDWNITVKDDFYKFSTSYNEDSGS